MSKFKTPLINLRKLFAKDVLVKIDKIQNDLEDIKTDQTLIRDEILKLTSTINLNLVNKGNFKISENEVIAKIFSGAKLLLDPRDKGLVPNLILDGEWESNITKAWLRVINKNDVIFDIGANFGYFSVLAAQQTLGNASLYLFEANPELMHYLYKTMEINSFSEISNIENIAVSDEVGEVKFNILKDYIASSSVHSVNDLNKQSVKKDYELSKSMTIKSVTIDEYCKKRNINEINLVKMDIEGYEDKAYFGMREITKKSPNITLFLEFTKGGYKDPKGFYNLLMSDFGNVYVINTEGVISKPKNNSYEHVIEKNHNWVMPIFSKNPNL